jgi:hypothetical protein
MRSDLRCPGCDVCGEAGGMTMFAERGSDERGSELLRCSNCGCGFSVVPSGLLRRKPRVELIDPDVWARMELAWERSNPLPSTAAPATPDPHELAAGLLMAGLSGPHVVHQLAEAADLTEADARRLLDELRGTPPV